MPSDGPSPRRLYLFQHAAGTLPGEPPIEMSAGSYLVQMSDGRNVLVDSGLAPDFAPPALAAITRGKTVLEHLAALDLRPDDIDVLVSTHFDVDHVGFHDAFPAAEHVVQREQYDLARAGHERFAAGRAHWDHPALRYRLVDGDTALLPGLRLIATSGHAPGHQSVVVELPQMGPVLLAIDAVAMQHLFTPERTPWPLDDDPEQLRASTRKLLDLVEREGISLVVFGHDGEQWQSLRKAPDFYE